MVTISTDDPVAVSVVTAVHAGDLAALTRLLAENPWLATARLGEDDPQGMSRTLLHVVTDWPGHFPHGAATVAALVEAGADVNARFRGPHEETPLHWAASSERGAATTLVDAATLGLSDRVEEHFTGATPRPRDRGARSATALTG